MKIKVGDKFIGREYSCFLSDAYFIILDIRKDKYNQTEVIYRYMSGTYRKIYDRVIHSFTPDNLVKLSPLLEALFVDD
jgi:hypothetical protein